MTVRTPHGWQETKWGNLATLEYGKSLRDYDEERSEAKPCRVFGTNGPIGWHSSPLCERASVVVGRKGAYRGIHFSPDPFFVIDTAFYLKPKSDFDIRWAYYQLKDFDINKLDSGSAIPSTSREAFYEIPVSLPPLIVQRRIAGILSAYDDLIENNQRRIKILEEMARSLYREWFVHFRFPGHEKVKMVPSALGLIPDNWEVLPLEAVCERITDGAHHSPKSVEDGFPMASVKDMQDWGFDLEGCRRISKEDYDNLVRNNCRPRKDDVLIAKDGSYLKHTFVMGEEQDLVILSSVAILRPNARIRSNYLNFILRSPDTKARMKGFVSGVALPRIILKDFRNFHIIAAPNDLQVQWAKHVDPMVQSCLTLTKMNDNLRSTRDLLLPRLLSGDMPNSHA